MHRLNIHLSISEHRVYIFFAIQNPIQVIIRLLVLSGLYFKVYKWRRNETITFMSRSNCTMSLEKEKFSEIINVFFDGFTYNTLLRHSCLFLSLRGSEKLKLRNSQNIHAYLYVKSSNKVHLFKCKRWKTNFHFDLNLKKSQNNASNSE